MKGHDVVLRSFAKPLATQHTDIRRVLAMIVAHASQQNARVQQCFNESGWATVIVPMLLAEKDPSALAALLHACSCLCRECDSASKLFITSGGIVALEEILRSTNAERVTPKILQRVLFFVEYLAQAGISSEALITATATHLSSSSSDVSVAAASTINAVGAKDISVVKTLVKPLLNQGFLSSITEADASDPRVVLKRSLSDEN